MQNDEIDLAPYWASIRKYWKLVLFWVVLGGLGMAAYTFLVPPAWEVKAALLLPLQSNSTSPLAGLLKESADPMEMMKGVIQSETVERAIGKDTGLDPRDIDRKLVVQTQKDQNQVLLSFIDRKSDLAMRVVNDAINNLREVSAGGNMSLNILQANALHDDLAKRSKHLNRLEDQLVAYTTHAKTPVDPTNPFASDLRAKAFEADYELKSVDQQIKTALDIASRMGKQGLKLPTAIPNQETLRERLVSAQFQLDTAMTTLGADNPTVKGLQAQIDVIKNLIKSEVSKYLTAANQGIDPMLAQLFGQRVLLQFEKDYIDRLAKAAPNEALSASRLYQEISMEQDGLKFAREEWEQARINALVDPLQWSIITPPYVDPKPANKRWALYPALGAFAGLFIGCIWGVLADKKRRTKSNSGLSDSLQGEREPATVS